MTYKHIEEPPKPVEKDFLIELAKSVELIRDCGLVIAGAKVELILPSVEFERAFNHFAKTVPVNGRPKNDFIINLSGIEVRLKRQ